MNEIEKLYKIAKEFAESKAKIKMPAFEKFEYDDCSRIKEFEYYYSKIGTEWLIYEDNKKFISLKIDYNEDESYIKIIKKYDDYSIVFSKII